jgi:crotonobetainyl-CoA:carnitine CoA-transferase CaiB-like acyl-CoA transferase
MLNNLQIDTERCLALKDIKIIDFAEVFAAPFGISLMADMGAEVIKVESFPRRSLTRPISIDARVADGPGPAYEKTAPQTQGNRNKLFLSLNLNHKDGKEIFIRLIQWADIIIDGYAAGVIDKLGFSWEKIHEINKSISMISMPAWGVEGPYTGYTALGSLVEASSGHVITRGNSQKPTEDILGTVQTDASAPLEVMFATIASMYRKKETGNGSFIDLSHLEAFAWYLPGMLSEWEWNKRLPKQLGNEDKNFVPHGCFVTSNPDEWVVIAVENDSQWQGLCQALSKENFAEIGHPWSSIIGRMSNKTAINEWIQKEVQVMKRSQIIDLLVKNNVITAPVINAPGLLTNDQLTSRNWWQSVDHKFLGNRLMSGFLWDIKPDKQKWYLPAGLLGEHNEIILKSLGFSKEEIKQFNANQVIGNEYTQ